MPTRKDPARMMGEYIQMKVKRIEDAIVNELGYIGEAATNQARDYNAKNNDYTDQTGNLRSSTGFNIVKNGKVIQASGFEKVKETATEGPGKGRGLAAEIAAQSFAPLNLIVVAGMEYAGEVAMRGRDVLDSAYIVANRGMEKMKKDFGLK